MFSIVSWDKFFELVSGHIKVGPKTIAKFWTCMRLSSLCSWTLFSKYCLWLIHIKIWKITNVYLSRCLRRYFKVSWLLLGNSLINLISISFCLTFSFTPVNWESELNVANMLSFGEKGWHLPIVDIRLSNLLHGNSGSCISRKNNFSAPVSNKYSILIISSFINDKGK